MANNLVDGSNYAFVPYETKTGTFTPNTAVLDDVTIGYVKQSGNVVTVNIVAALKASEADIGVWNIGTISGVDVREIQATAYALDADVNYFPAMAWIQPSGDLMFYNADHPRTVGVLITYVV